MSRVQDWMTDVVNSGSWRTFDDLHIDEIVPDLPKSAWVWEATRAAREAAVTRDELAPSFAVILAFSLCASSRPIAPQWLSIRVLTDDLDGSPPSLYVFERSSERWRALLEDTTKIQSPPFLGEGGEVRYREVWEESDREYRRSVLLIQ